MYSNCQYRGIANLIVRLGVVAGTLFGFSVRVPLNEFRPYKFSSLPIRAASVANAKYAGTRIVGWHLKAAVPQRCSHEKRSPIVYDDPDSFARFTECIALFKRY